MTREELPGLINQAVERRFFKAPAEAKRVFPEILRDAPRYVFNYEERDRVFLLVFLSPDNVEKFRVAVEEDRNPFPGLVVQGEFSVAFAMEGSRYSYIRHSVAENMGLLRLKGDTSTIIEGTQVILNDSSGGRVHYEIDLGFVVSFSEEQDASGIARAVDDLFAYATKIWKEKGAEQARVRRR